MRYSKRSTKIGQGRAVYPDTSPQLSMFDSDRICRDGMGPMNETISVSRQSRPARQSLCNDFWGKVSRLSLYVSPMYPSRSHPSLNNQIIHTKGPYQWHKLPTITPSRLQTGSMIMST